MSTSTMTVTNVALFLVLISTQVAAVSLLPRTAGFTNLYWTAIVLITFGVSLWSLATIIHAGVPLGLMMPIVAALVPLGAIAAGVLFYKETASLLRILLLCSACGIIGVASAVK